MDTGISLVKQAKTKQKNVSAFKECVLVPLQEFQRLLAYAAEKEEVPPRQPMVAARPMPKMPIAARPMPITYQANSKLADIEKVPSWFRISKSNVSNIQVNGLRLIERIGEKMKGVIGWNEMGELEIMGTPVKGSKIGALVEAVVDPFYSAKKAFKNPGFLKFYELLQRNGLLTSDVGFNKVKKREFEKVNQEKTQREIRNYNRKRDEENEKLENQKELEKEIGEQLKVLERERTRQAREEELFDLEEAMENAAINRQKSKRRETIFVPPPPPPLPSPAFAERSKYEYDVRHIPVAPPLPGPARVARTVNNRERMRRRAFLAKLDRAEMVAEEGRIKGAPITEAREWKKRYEENEEQDLAGVEKLFLQKTFDHNQAVDKIAGDWIEGIEEAGIYSYEPEKLATIKEMLKKSWTMSVKNRKEAKAINDEAALKEYARNLFEKKLGGWIAAGSKIPARLQKEERGVDEGRTRREEEKVEEVEQTGSGAFPLNVKRWFTLRK